MTERDARSRAGTLAGVCVAIVIALVALQLLRSTGAPEGPNPNAVPTASVEIPQAKMRCSDPKCVAGLARAAATKLASAGNAEDAKHITAAADALERNDCNAAMDARNAVNSENNRELLIELADFTGELMNVCLLGGDMFASGDASTLEPDDDVAGPGRVRMELALSDRAFAPIARQAGELHHSVSWIVVEAWRRGKSDIAKLGPATTDASVPEAGAAGPQIVYLPADVANQIDAEVARTHRPREALIEHAWLAATQEIAKLDAGIPPDGG